MGVPIADKKKEVDVVTPHNYQFKPERDYFKGVPNIFNSELAALAYCTEQWDKCMKDKKNPKKYGDPHFGPSESDPHGAYSLYFDCSCQYPMVDPEDIEWKRPEEFLVYDDDYVAKPAFVSNDASANEVLQGKLGDCWFISALSVLASKDELIRGSTQFIDFDNIQMFDKTTVENCSNGVYPPLFHRFRTVGLYVMRFFKDFRWRYVVIDDKLPVE